MATEPPDSTPSPSQRSPLTLEQVAELREQHQVFLEQWRTELAPLFEDKRVSLKGAIDFGQAVLRSCFLLNGGALVLLPTFGALIGVKGMETAARLVGPFACFVGGLVFCVLGALFGHWALRSDVTAFSHQLTERSLAVTVSHGKEPNTPASQNRIQSERDLAASSGKVARSLASAGALMAILSLVMFSVGAWLGALWLVH